MYFEIINLKIVCRLTHNTFTADGKKKLPLTLIKDLFADTKPT
jgi:hypothetical protein